MTRRTMIVYDGADGSSWVGEYPVDTKPAFKREYKEKKYAGYLSGYRTTTTRNYGVMAFFKEKPTQAEILRRRTNGFKAAKWNKL